MTREEAIKYLRQIYPNGGHCWLDSQRIEAIEMAIEALSITLPSDLDKAAEEYEAGLHFSISAAFISGAEWMAGQGETVEGVFRAGDPGYPDVRMGEQYSIEHILRKPGGIEPGDNVVVQIRKK